MKLLGKPVADKVKESVKKEIEEKSLTPTLAVIIVGNDPASMTYVKNKTKACDFCGINHVDYLLSENIEETELINIIQQLNLTSEVDGILVQLPLPLHINERTVIEAIDPRKDVDCFTYENVGRLMTGNPRFKPCTPAGIVEMLKYYNIPLEGKNVAVLGRSNIVGKPISMLLQQENANVSMFHSKSGKENIFRNISNSCDIIIAATGNPSCLPEADVVFCENATLIDVGIHRNEEGKVYGDVGELVKEDWFANYSPVPGGVGPMTIAMLMKNVLEAHKNLR